MIELTPEASPGVQALLVDSRDREHLSVSSREMRAETIVGGSFLVVAVAMALLLDSGRSFEVLQALMVFATLVVASLIVFEVGSVYTWPGQVAFVPGLFLLPPEFVPLVVAAALITGKLLDTPLGACPGSRVDGARRLLVRGRPGAGAPRGGHAGSRSMSRSARSCSPSSRSSPARASRARVRESLHGGASLREQMIESAWIYSIDALLSCRRLRPRPRLRGSARRPLLLVIPLFGRVRVPRPAIAAAASTRSSSSATPTGGPPASSAA